MKLYITKLNICTLLLYILVSLWVTVKSEEIKPKFNTTEVLTHTEGTAAESEDTEEDVIGHLFGLSISSPVSKEISKRPNARQDLQSLKVIFEKFYNLSESRRKRVTSNACDLPEKRYLRDSWFSSKFRQIGRMNQTCDTRIFAKEAVASKELNYDEDVKPVQSIMTRAKHSLYEAMSNISEIPPRFDPKLNWTQGTFPLTGWQFQRNNQRCSTENYFVYYLEPHWYFAVTITNAPIATYKGNWERQYITEYVRDDLGPSLHTVHPIYTKTTEGTNGSLVDASTTIERWGGPVGLSEVGNMPFDRNPALIRALNDNAGKVDLASDSITWSNIALLTLPMVMSLIPVAFIAEFNTIATIAYMVFTDIFSVIPLLIKGIELLESTAKSEEVVVYKLGTKKLMQMEIFAAQCSGEENFRKWGVVFIAISVLGIVVGASLEVFAYHFMRYQRVKQGKDDIDGPFGLAGFINMEDAIIRKPRKTENGLLGFDGIFGFRLFRRNQADGAMNTVHLRYSEERHRRYSECEQL